MESWLKQISSMTDYDELVYMKEQIKEEAVQNIPWQKRIELYERVKWINKRIQELR